VEGVVLEAHVVVLLQHGEQFHGRERVEAVLPQRGLGGERLLGGQEREERAKGLVERAVPHDYSGWLDRYLPGRKTDRPVRFWTLPRVAAPDRRIGTPIQRGGRR